MKDGEAETFLLVTFLLCLPIYPCHNVGLDGGMLLVINSASVSIMNSNVKGVPKNCFYAEESHGRDGNFGSVVSNNAILLVARVRVVGVLSPLCL